MGEKLAEVDVTAVKDHFSAYGGLGNIQIKKVYLI
jgi:hypothetical protein